MPGPVRGIEGRRRLIHRLLPPPEATRQSPHHQLRGETAQVTTATARFELDGLWTLSVPFTASKPSQTFRIHAEKLHVPSACDILICDEAHRLKNDATLTNRALDALPCKRRVLLSGTPLQNDLAEFFAMVDFTNPGLWILI